MGQAEGLESFSSNAPRLETQEGLQRGVVWRPCPSWGVIRGGGRPGWAGQASCCAGKAGCVDQSFGSKISHPLGVMTSESCRLLLRGPAPLWEDCRSNQQLAMDVAGILALHPALESGSRLHQEHGWGGWILLFCCRD